MTVLAWQRAGGPDGPTVVLVHAWAADAVRDWESTGWVERLATAGFDVLVPDLPGHGESADVLLPPEAEPSSWTASVLGHDLTVLGASHVQVVGHGEGCLVAGHLAVRGATGDPGPPRPSEAVQVESLTLVNADDRNGIPQSSEIATALLDPGSRVWHPEAAEAVSRARTDRRHHLPTLALWAEQAAWPAAPRLGALHIPVLLAVSADDERRQRAPRLAQLFHDARLVTVPGDRSGALLAVELVTTAVAFLGERPAAS